MRLLFLWYSRTGTTEAAVAEARAWAHGRGHRVRSQRIRPRWDLPYPAWLALSFVPGARAPLRDDPPDPAAYDGVLLALPKWTFACPPVNQAVARLGGRLPPTAVLVTCGGWDQERYLRALERRLQRLGVTVRAGTALRKKAVDAGTAWPALHGFLDRAFPPARTT